MEQTLNYSKWYFEIKSEACPDLLVDATTTMWGSIFDDFLFPSIRVRSWPTMRESFSLLWKRIKISFTHTKKRDMQNLPIVDIWHQVRGWISQLVCPAKPENMLQKMLHAGTFLPLPHGLCVQNMDCQGVTRSNIFQIMSKNTLYNCTCQH